MNPCLDLDQIMRAADGEPGSATEHLAACDACRARVERVGAMGRLLKRSIPVPVPAPVLAPRRAGRRAIFLPAAALFLFGFVLYLILGQSGGGDGKGPSQDASGDALPPGALARLGSRRFRHAGAVSFGPGGWIYAVAHSPDGKTIVSGGDDGELRLWEATTGKAIRSIPMAPGPIPGMFHPLTTLAISPDGTEIAAPEGVGPIGVWTAADGKRIATLEGHAGGTTGILYSPDGRTLASIGGDQQVHVWDRTSRAKLRSLPMTGTAPGRSLAFSPDGRLLAAVRYQEIVLWNTADGERIRSLTAPMYIVGRVAFSPDGRSIASVSSDRMLRFWGVADGVERHKVQADERSANDLAWTPDGRILVTCGTDGALRFWNAATAQLISKVDHVGASSISLSPDGRTLATAGKRIRIWDVATAKEAAGTPQHDSAVASAAFSPDGTTVASGGWDAYRLWDARSGKHLRAIERNEPPVRNENEKAEPVRHVVFTAGGALAGWAAEDMRFRLRELETGRDLLSVDLEGGRTPRPPLAFDPASRTFAAGATSVDVGDTRRTDGASTTLWTLTGGKVLARVGDDREPARCLALSPDGKTLAVGQQDGTVTVWDVVGGKAARALRPAGDASEPVSCVAYSPDGRLLASGHRSGAARIWELATGQEVLLLQGHDGEVTSADFATDLRRIATASTDGTVLVWSLEPRGAAAIDGRWEALESPDARAAYAAGWKLTGDAEGAVPFLREKLRLDVPSDPARLRKLIADLDHEDVGVRENATRELAELGEGAAAELRRTWEAGGSAELRGRARALIEAMDSLPSALRALRVAQTLERIGTPAAERVLADMAAKAAWPKARKDAEASLLRLKARPAGR